MPETLAHRSRVMSPYERCDAVDNLLRFGASQPIGAYVDEAHYPIAVDNDNGRLGQLPAAGAGEHADPAVVVGRYRRIVVGNEGDAEAPGQRVAAVRGDFESQIVADADLVEAFFGQMGADPDQPDTRGLQ